MGNRTGFLAALVFFLLVLCASSTFGGDQPPSKAGRLYNHHATVDRYLGARNLSDNPPAIPNSDPAAASPRWLAPGGSTIPHGVSLSQGRGAEVGGAAPSARGRDRYGWLQDPPRGFDNRSQWPLGLTPYDRKTQRNLAKVIHALD